MTCIHGLDEVNCPTCRILKSTTPLKTPSLKNTNILKIEHPTFKNNKNLSQKLINEITSKKTGLNTPNYISKPRFINEIPNFRNELFFERVNELDLVKEDNHGITKKIPLESPEWKFEEED